MNTKMIDPLELRRNIHKALCYLSGRCDGAEQRDNAGFNGSDSFFGKNMAASDPDHWSPKATAILGRMVQKYRKQLLAGGIDVTGLDVPEGKIPGVIRTAKSTILAAREQPKPNSEVVALDKGVYQVKFPYDPTKVNAIKALPWKCRKFDSQSKSWVVRPGEVEGAAGQFFAFLKSNGFEVPEELAADLHEAGKSAEDARKAREAARELSRAVDGEIEIPALNAELKPFQKAGVAYSLRTKRAFIADEMGLGKTIQGLAAVEAAGAYPLLVVARPSLIRGWIRQIQSFLPGRTVGSVFDRRDITVVSHHELVKYADALADELKFNSMIIDESQDFKNAKAARSKAAKQVADAQAPEYRFLLSGTPVPNRHAEYIHQLAILGRLEDFGGWKRFTDRYCGAFRGAFGLDISRSINGEELNEKLRERCFIRRLKRDVLSELPDKQRDIIEVSLDTEGKRAYSAAKADVARRVEELKQKAREEATEFLSAAADMTFEEMYEMAVAAGLLGGEVERLKVKGRGDKEEVYKALRGHMMARVNNISGAEAIMLMGELKRVAARAKVKQFIEWAEDATADGEKLIVFAYSVEIQRELAAAIPGAIWTRSSEYRCPQDAVDRFKDDPSVRVIVCSLSGDNAGLNGMQVATKVAFIEYGWVWDDHLQAEDRAHRIGQKSAVNCYYFTATGTIDETIWTLLQSKREIGEKAVDGQPVASASSVAKEAARALNLI